MREQASRTFAGEIVATFYDNLVPLVRNGWQLRNAVISLPTPDTGYTRVLSLGTTGAGKTTLVRQLIGTGRKGEKFPSTAPARTTTCNIEIITADSREFEIAVSFLPKDLVRQYVEECVTAAAISTLKREPHERTVQRFLEHNDQRFRLTYILGTLDADADDEEIEDAGEEFELADAATSEDRERFAVAIQEYLTRISSVANVVSRKLESTLNFSLDSASQNDRDTFEELLEDDLRDQDDFHELVDDVLDAIESRFDLLADGELHREESEWPKRWAYHSGDREDFLRRASQFTSNQAPQFGRLLTPLVEGIRVRGPFRPAWWAADAPKLVLMDGRAWGTLQTQLRASRRARPAATRSLTRSSLSTTLRSRWSVPRTRRFAALSPMVSSRDSWRSSLISTKCAARTFPTATPRSSISWHRWINRSPLSARRWAWTEASRMR